MPLVASFRGPLLSANIARRVCACLTLGRRYRKVASTQGVAHLPCLSDIWRPTGLLACGSKECLWSPKLKSPRSSLLMCWSHQLLQLLLATTDATDRPCTLHAKRGDACKRQLTSSTLVAGKTWICFTTPLKSSRTLQRPTSGDLPLVRWRLYKTLGTNKAVVHLRSSWLV